MLIQKNKFTLITSIIIIISLVSCSPSNRKSEERLNLVQKDGLLYRDSLATSPYSGTYKGRVMGGNLIEYDVVEGVKHGKFIIYDEHENIIMHGNMSHNLNNGEWKYYHPNGVVESVGSFRNDTLTGEWKWYYMTSTIQQKGNYSNGKMDGDWNSYNEFGSETLIMKYSQGKLIDSVAIAHNQPDSSVQKRNN